MKESTRLIVPFAFVLLMILSSNVAAQTPNFNEFFKQKKTQIRYLVRQIAALQVYLERLKKGYEIVDKGLTTIGNIKDGKFSMDKDYQNSLKRVSPVVAGSPLADQILRYNEQTLAGLTALQQEVNGNVNFTEEEHDYVGRVRLRALTQTNAWLDELRWILSAGQSEMTDDERLGHLERLHGHCKRGFLFSGEFVRNTRLLVRQRAKEQQTIDVLRKLYGVTL
jgi:hypothetical protein